ncbi:MAG TPA: nucleotide disphospho-sugar-binding domain-containing protein, partial [Longimicrobium sp.]
GALQRIITALGTLEVRGLVTLGPAMAGEPFDLPANVVTVPSAPHAQVFPHAAAVITHAGHGTVMRALANGVPLLCLPMGRDQDDNAARAVFRGAGLRLRPSASPSRIAAAVRRLLAEPGFREAAARLGRVIRDDVAEDRAVRELEAAGAEARVEVQRQEDDSCTGGRPPSPALSP